MEIRPASRQEVGDFFRRAEDTFYEGRRSALLGSDRVDACDEYFVAEIDGQIVGAVTLAFEAINGPTLETLYVWRDLQRRGIGPALCETAARRFTEVGKTPIACEVENAAMHKAIQKLPNDLQARFRLKLSYLEDGDLDLDETEMKEMMAYKYTYSLWELYSEAIDGLQAIKSECDKNDELFGALSEVQKSGLPGPLRDETLTFMIKRDDDKLNSRISFHLSQLTAVAEHLWKIEQYDEFRRIQANLKAIRPLIGSSAKLIEDVVNGQSVIAVVFDNESPPKAVTGEVTELLQGIEGYDTEGLLAMHEWPIGADPPNEIILGKSFVQGVYRVFPTLRACQQAGYERIKGHFLETPFASWAQWLEHKGKHT